MSIVRINKLGVSQIVFSSCRCNIPNCIINTAPGELPAKLAQILAERRDRYAAADLQIPITAHVPPSEIVDRILLAIPTVLKAKAQ
jgi:hypothetical protein